MIKNSLAGMSMVTEQRNRAFFVKLTVPLSIY